MSNEEDEDYNLIDDIPQKKGRKPNRSLRLNYDSDSSVEDYNEGQDGLESKAENEQKVSNEINEDSDGMFSSDEDEDKKNGKDQDVKVPETDTTNSASKDTGQYLDIDQFEKDEKIGAYDEETYDGSDSRSVESENLAEEDRQAQLDYYNNIEDFDAQSRPNREKHGIKMESFDLKDEAKEGKFDADGNFIRDPDAEDEQAAQDQWIDDTKGSDISKARMAQLEREQAFKNKSKKEVASTDELLSSLIQLLEPAESPLEALARLQPPKKRRKHKKEVDQKAPLDDERKNQVFHITELCNDLIHAKGISEVYELSREELMRKYRLETGEDYKLPQRGTKRSFDQREEHSDDDMNNDNDPYYNDKVWEYVWTDEVGGEILGPFTSYEMNFWAESYFENKVLARKVGEEEFKHISKLKFNN